MPLPLKTLSSTAAEPPSACVLIECLVFPRDDVHESQCRSIYCASDSGPTGLVENASACAERFTGNWGSSEASRCTKGRVERGRPHIQIYNLRLRIAQSATGREEHRSRHCEYGTLYGKPGPNGLVRSFTLALLEFHAVGSPIPDRLPGSDIVAGDGRERGVARDTACKCLERSIGVVFVSLRKPGVPSCLF
jgi:hypothetical protein